MVAALAPVSATVGVGDEGGSDGGAAGPPPIVSVLPPARPSRSPRAGRGRVGEERVLRVGPRACHPLVGLGRLLRRVAPGVLWRGVGGRAGARSPRTRASARRPRCRCGGARRRGLALAPRSERTRVAPRPSVRAIPLSQWLRREQMAMRLFGSALRARVSRDREAQHSAARVFSAVRFTGSSSCRSSPHLPVVSSCSRKIRLWNSMRGLSAHGSVDRCGVRR